MTLYQTETFKCAQEGDEYCNFVVGHEYMVGSYQKMNNDSALKYLLRSENANISTAQIDIANIYQGKGSVKNWFIWIKRAAENGECLAMQNVGISYEKGIVVEKIGYWLMSGSAKRLHKATQIRLKI